MKVTSFCLVLILLVLGNIFSSFGRSSAQDTGQTQEKIYEAKEVDRKAKLQSDRNLSTRNKPAENAPPAGFVLRVVLKSSGEIGDIKIIRDAPDGLTEECLKVVREIKFEPAVKDGKPVSQYARVEYTFTTD